jgi:hypothetical protein
MAFRLSTNSRFYRAFGNSPDREPASMMSVLGMALVTAGVCVVVPVVSLTMFMTVANVIHEATNLNMVASSVCVAIAGAAAFGAYKAVNRLVVFEKEPLSS